MTQLCNSCKEKITNDVGTVSFQCPQCGKTSITRCSHCRKTAVKYTCHECEFRGPN
ncbi:RNA-binding protein [Candidatus Woesearchaeota archaeon CG10_big_fil_rev_8_21_14_0_10_30_7]|nr:MAG: RNA-binding protein [Candidatus Woesearchaeota archaeon CG10_big_fil_rev_8_21_14_0_10_30_7]